MDEGVIQYLFTIRITYSQLKRHELCWNLNLEPLARQIQDGSAHHLATAVPLVLQDKLKVKLHLCPGFQSWEFQQSFQPPATKFTWFSRKNILATQKADFLHYQFIFGIEVVFNIYVESTKEQVVYWNLPAQLIAISHVQFKCWKTNGKFSLKVSPTTTKVYITFSGKLTLFHFKLTIFLLQINLL